MGRIHKLVDARALFRRFTRFRLGALGCTSQRWRVAA